MARYLVFFWSLTSYLVFFGVFVYAIGFLGNIIVPQSLDSEVRVDAGWAILINATLLVMFAVQHSVMARPAFKRWICRWIPAAAERSTYVMATNVALIALFIFWQPLGPVFWDIQQPVARAIIQAVYFAGWGFVFVATCLISHFDLFGLRQGWLYFQGQPYRPLRFVTPAIYKMIRHPLYVGWFTVFWAAPTMTGGHLFFAVITTGYILAAIQLEERDLISEHGSEYVKYRNEVPMFVPRLTRKQPTEPRAI